MKLHLLNRTSLKNSSFTVTDNQYPHFLKVWHYHPELELVVINQSTGTRFIGDSIEKFEEGEVILIGENLPHMWLNDPEYFEEGSNLKASALALHFNQNFLGTHFFEVPEMKSISELIRRAVHGIQFLQLDSKVVNRILNLQKVDSFKRVIELIEILNLLAKHSEYRLLSSAGFVNSFNPSANKNLDKVYEFVFKNFKNPIGSKEVAKVANMNPSAFSRFFKRVHRKTFTKYLNEIRIGYACKQLIENKYNVSGVCYESGFNNISNFNRQFKEIVKMSPTDFVKYHTTSLEDQ